jgi:SAM-dependent methyltransferase
MEARKKRERDFHDHAFSHDARAGADKFYSIFGPVHRFYEEFLRSRCANARVLEYGCGQGSHSFFLAGHGASVTGIDISEVAIREARVEARRRGLSTVRYEIMDAEALSFADSSFDLICGSGILHHLDLERALSELVRVLTPAGSAIFIEPLAHNPLINLYRRLTPRMRTADEHPLRLDDLRRMGRHFQDVEYRYYGGAALMAVPFRSVPGFRYLLGGLDALDRLIFSSVPPARGLAWVVVMILSRPRPTTSPASP